MTSFQPMLSGKAPADLTKIKYPVLVSPKLDGIRCVIRDGVALSRKLKPIPNRHVQDMLSGLPDGLDGELIVGPPTGADVWNRTQSGVMSEDGEPDFRYWVFDWVASCRDKPFEHRYAEVCGIGMANRLAKPVPHTFAACADDLAVLESKYVNEGYEGAMIRSIDGPYKFGRSTTKEGYLLKLKRFNDAEATIIDVVERMHNANEATIDERGYTKRSSHKANKVGRGDLGALVCRTRLRPDCAGVEFELGTGFTDEQRRSIWSDWTSGELAMRGMIVRFKYQDLTPDGVPRFPVFLGFRDERDT